MNKSYATEVSKGIKLARYEEKKMPKDSFRKGDLVLNLLKKLKPYLILIILIIYVEVIGNGKLINSINEVSFYYELVNQVISRFVVGSLVGVILYILNLDDLKLTLKINVHYLMIALFLILIYCSRYISIIGFQVNISIAIPYLLVASPVILYVFPVLVGYYLSKGLISTKRTCPVPDTNI